MGYIQNPVLWCKKQRKKLDRALSRKLKTILWVTSIALVCFIIYPSVIVSADFLGDILKKELPQLPGARELPMGQAAGKGGSP
jgi:hypothetical protein